MATALEKVWASTLINGGKTWDNVPTARIAGVLEELQARVASGIITAERYKEITGMDYEGSLPGDSTAEE